MKLIRRYIIYTSQERLRHEKNVIVQKSSIHGKGLFARRKISSGTCIGVLKGRPSRRAGKYAMIVLTSDDRQVEVKAEGPLRYVNHSDHPNAELYTLDDSGAAELIATRSIEAGEEITVDYAGDL